MKRFGILFLSFFLLLPVMAQEEDAASAAFERLIPSNVRLRLDETTGNATLVFNASPAVCEELLTDVTIEGNIIDVDAYVPLSAQGATCNFIAPYEPVIELGELAPDVSYVLLLNDFATTFFVPQPEGQIMDMPFTMTWGEDNPLFGARRVDSYVNSVEIGTEDEALTITVQGSHPDGCETEMFTWLRQDEVDSLVYHLEIFRLFPDGVMCPAVLQDFNTTVNTGLPADGSYYFEAGENWFVFNENGATPVLNVPIAIETVAVVEAGDGYEVTVTGALPNCGVDLSSAEAAKDYASFIRLSLYFPLDNGCTDENNAYEGLFVVETLPVIINGVAYDENGILPPTAQSVDDGSDQGQGGGSNLMQVDTVIESVEVLILESFPMQLELVVTGYQPDGCEAPVIVEQQREGNVVTVHVYRELPPDVMCTMMIVPYEETIRIEGGFEGGTVEIRVNEFTTSVDL